MRLRNIKGADEAVLKSPCCIQSPQKHKGLWQDYFGSRNPVHIEIGMGKGQFIMALAKQRPQINYLGIERYTSVLLRALQKTEPDPPANLRFLCIDARTLSDIFACGEVKRIYLNFSDPWPKDRHAKRRLTSAPFLQIYDQILDPSGTLEFKTDNRGLFDFSLEEIPAAGWRIDAFTRDLHHDPTMNEGNIMTEYEEKFSAAGNPIFKLVASR